MRVTDPQEDLVQVLVAVYGSTDRTTPIDSAAIDVDGLSGPRTRSFTIRDSSATSYTIVVDVRSSSHEGSVDREVRGSVSPVE